MTLARAEAGRSIKNATGRKACSHLKIVANRRIKYDSRKEKNTYALHHPS